MAKSYKCRWCGKMYPPAPDYERCPICREATIDAHVEPMDAEEARALRQEMDFGWWLWDTGKL